MFRFQIITFGLNDFVKVFWHVGVVGRDKAGFELYAQFPQIFGIEIEIVVAQGADTHQV